MLRTLALATAAAFAVLGAPASAQQLMTAPPPGMAAVAILQARPDAAGDHRRYESRSDTVVTGEAARTQHNRQVFDLDVLAVEAGGQRLKLRYTLVKGELTDTSDPDGETALKAWLGVAIEFDANNEGLPMAITNWPAARAAYVANFNRLAPTRGDMRGNIEAYFDRLESRPASLAQVILGDPMALAGMQVRVPVVFGRSELPAETRDVPDGKLTTRRSMDLSAFHQDTCVAELARETSMTAERGPRSSTSVLKTTAQVSAYDGWVISLSQVQIDERSGQRKESRTTLVRLAPDASCPARGRA